MRRTENPQNVVRLHEVPLMMPYGITAAQQVLALLVKVRLLLGRRHSAPWCNGSIPDFGSGGGGSNPSGAVYLEFVAEWFRRKFVALVNAGSNPVKLPLLDVVLNGSIRGLGPCGVSSSLAIQTKKAPSLASKPMKESLCYTKFRMAISLFSTFFRTFRVLAVLVFSLFPSRVMASFISLQSSADKGISVME